MRLLPIIALFGLICCAIAQTPCSARITATARANSGWTDGITRYQVYDITATNQGACPLLRVVGFFSAGAGRITEAWNYDYTSGLITGYGSALQVGQTFTGAGFVLANSSTPALAFTRPGCDDACLAANTPTTPAPTSTPTSAPTSCGTTSCAANQICLTGEQGQGTCYYRLCSDLVCAGPNQICINNGGVARCITTGTQAPTTTAAAPTTTTTTAAPTIAAPTTTTTTTTTASCGATQCGSNQLCVSSESGPTCYYRSCSDLVCAGVNQVCINDGGLARCITTGAPTSTTPTTTPTPTTTTVSPADSCSHTATVVRDANSWTDAQGRNNTIHRLVVTNNGPCTLTLLVTSFAFYPATLVSSWNLTPTRGGYIVQGFGSGIAPGATYSGAGIILANAPENVVATGYGSTCRC